MFMLLMNEMFINIISILDTNNVNNSNFNDDSYNYDNSNMYMLHWFIYIIILYYYDHRYNFLF